MRTFHLDKKAILIVQELIEKDIENLAEEPSYFEQVKVIPRDYIDERIKFAMKFDLDFWRIVLQNCGDYHLDRLKALYEGKSMSEFIETYDK
jgi:hypothetical protein